MRISLVILSLAALLVGGCASRQPKSSTRIYEGSAPSIHITGEESAGGPLGTR